MDINLEQIRGHRLAAHHLDEKLAAGEIPKATGACGLQNSPPGAWETSLWNRAEGCSLNALNDALYRDKTVIQAWSFRGVPAVFPTEEKDVFLTALLARRGEEPWIYTRGVGLALDYLQMSFVELLPIVERAAGYLDDHAVKSKEELDRVLAEIAGRELPREKLPLWRAPSMYDIKGKQTVGGAVVSFLLRPCSFASLVVFGGRQGVSPTFTSMTNWLGYMPEPFPGAEKELVRRFLHCYGPASRNDFTGWLGCSPVQARRLWDAVADEMECVTAEGKTRHILAEDRDSLSHAECDADRLLLLGAHDPYLDLRDKATILPDKSMQKTVWRTVANPGAVTKGGQITGIWKSKTMKDKLDIAITLWKPLALAEQAALKRLAEEYAAFRLLKLRNCTLETA